MSPRATMRRLGIEERGNVLVTTAIVLPVIILFMVFVIDVANWFEHKRHLQLQVDAAALAAAQDVKVPCSDTPINNTVNAYGGGTYNPQVGGGQSRVHLLVNSNTFYNQSVPPDSDIPSTSPCSASMIDVKGTETDLPFLFKVAKVNFINAQARVSIQQADILNNFIPVSITEANYKKVQIKFINEATGAVLKDTAGNDAERLLTANGTDASGNTIWDNATDALPMVFAPGVDRIGVLVRLSNTTSLTCGDPGVLCYNAAQTQGLLFARGYTVPSPVTSGQAPKVGNVTLGSGTCSDGGSYFTNTTLSPCLVTVTASVDWGVKNPGSTFTGIVNAYVDGGNTPYSLACGPGPSATIHDSVCTGAIPVTGSGNAQAITQLNWNATKGTIGLQNCNTTTCSGTLETSPAVQRAFAASSAGSGPIQMAQIWENGAAGANSFVQCASSCNAHNLVVKLSVPASLAVAQSVGDPVYKLRTLNGNSQTQAIDCDTNLSNFKDELAFGCKTPSYVKNTGQSCAGYTGPAQLPDPSPCAVTQTSASGPSQVGAGLNMRILGDEKAKTCTNPNHWYTQFPNFDPGDPRIVLIIVTPLGSFGGSGNEAFPVQDFAAFYITGWQGNNGFDNPCQKLGGGDDAAGVGEIVGHWIKYINPLNTGGGGTQPCDFSALDPCIATLTR